MKIFQAAKSHNLEFQQSNINYMSSPQPKEALIWRLRLIFLYYSSYADRNNYKSLKCQNYRRFLIDSQAVTDNAAFPPYDIAFRKIHTSAITLEQLQELLPTIAQLVYPKKSRKQAFRLFLGLHMEKLYTEIINRSEFGSDIKVLQNLKISNSSLQLLDSIPIHKAYQMYIESTSMHQKQPEHTFEEVHTFLSEFEVSPKLVYKAMVYLTFFHFLRDNHSQSWGLVDFQKLIIALAELHWRRNEDSEVGQQQKVVRLLQHMQISQGFQRMVDKTLKQNAILISFFKRQTRRISDLAKSRELLGSIEKYQPKSTRNVDGSRYFSAKKSRFVDNAPVQGLLDQEGDTAIKMRDIFERLCSHGQVGNHHTLKSIKIKRYFNTLNIMAPLQQTWVDIAIAQLCRTSPSGKIQFAHFLQLIQWAASKLKIPNQTLFHYLIQQSLGDSQSSKGYFSANKAISQVPKEQITQQVLFQVQKSLERIYNYYRKGKKGLSFDQLCHLLFEFQIFPTFINKSKLYSLFQLRSKAANALKKLVGEVLLDLRGYIQLLGDISYQLSDNLSEQERTLFLLQHMQDSQGHRTVLGTQGTNLIGDLRSKYAAIYRQNLQKQSPSKVEDFSQLLADYDAS